MREEQVSQKLVPAGNATSAAASAAAGCGSAELGALARRPGGPTSRVLGRFFTKDLQSNDGSALFTRDGRSAASEAAEEAGRRRCGPGRSRWWHHSSLLALARVALPFSIKIFK